MTAAAKTRRPAAPPSFYRPESWRREESIGYLMGRAINIVKEAVDEELAPTGLTHAQWVPLLKVYLGEASTVAELARETQVDVGAMTRTLDRLEMKGLVRRVRSSEDRRVVNVELTGEGTATAKQIPSVLCRVQNAHLRGFSQEEWQMLKSLLRRVLDNAIELQEEREGRTSP
ncbi:MAG TPA: MarR family transcriptional regulator [Ramlibacter sp.]|nr:MarR family transcriptional regulator [Ramlibacter sp.]